ncbi:MAG: hypothetical protein IPM60_04245 [Rhodospirillales bacterium]|nr:hypothetical protein [Rhodospirillales bacterium]
MPQATPVERLEVSVFVAPTDAPEADRQRPSCWMLDSGCCGMAWSFGFEKEHYDVSMKAGERVLLPAVRAAAEDCLIIYDGYSCREQIAQAKTRRAIDLAEVLDLTGQKGERR